MSFKNQRNESEKFIRGETMMNRDRYESCESFVMYELKKAQEKLEHKEQKMYEAAKMIEDLKEQLAVKDRRIVDLQAKLEAIANSNEDR